MVINTETEMDYEETEKEIYLNRRENEETVSDR